MARTPDHLVFDPLAPAAVVARMRAALEARTGWVNLEPEVPDPDGQPPGATGGGGGGGGGIFSNRGPAIPLCTWTPPAVGRRGVVGPQSLGVQHGLGARARPRLDQVGLDLPPGWVVRADHPKRGLVVEAPAATDPATALDWLLAAGEAVATVAVTGRWHAWFEAGR